MYNYMYVLGTKPHLLEWSISVLNEKSNFKSSQTIISFTEYLHRHVSHLWEGRRTLKFITLPLDLLYARMYIISTGYFLSYIKVLFLCCIRVKQQIWYTHDTNVSIKTESTVHGSQEGYFPNLKIACYKRTNTWVSKIQDMKVWPNWRKIYKQVQIAICTSANICWKAINFNELPQTCDQCVTWFYMYIHECSWMAQNRSNICTVKILWCFLINISV